MAKLDTNGIRNIEISTLPSFLIDGLEKSKHTLHIQENYYTWEDDNIPSDNSDDWAFITTTDIQILREMKIELSEKELEHLVEIFKDNETDTPQVPKHGLKIVKIILAFTKYISFRTFDEEYDVITNELIKLHVGN